MILGIIGPLVLHWFRGFDEVIPGFVRVMVLGIFRFNGTNNAICSRFSSLS